MKKHLVMGIQVALFVVFLSLPAYAANVLDPYVCDYKCALCINNDPLKCDGVKYAACLARQTDCQVKLNLFNAYLGQMGLGVSLYAMDGYNRAILAPYFPTIDLSAWRFGFSDRQPPDNATTDCNTTYFNNASFVNNLTRGHIDLSNRVTSADGKRVPWVLHELYHYVQCNNVGGRTAYARMWFDNLLRMNWGSLDPTKVSLDNLSPIFNLMHDSMPMEQDAQNNGDTIWTTLNSCCVATDSTLFPPLKINVTGVITPQDPNALIQTIYPGKTVTLNATLTGGSAPFSYFWSIQMPGAASFTAIPASEGYATGPAFTWTPKVVGSYRIKLVVSQNKMNITGEKISTHNVVTKPVLRK